MMDVWDSHNEKKEKLSMCRPMFSSMDCNTMSAHMVYISSFIKHHYNEVVVHQGTMDFVGLWYSLIMDPNVQLKRAEHRKVQQRNY